MNIKIDDFLTAEQLGEASHNQPANATVKDIHFIDASDLPFQSSKGRYELLLEMSGEEWKWLANKTSLRSLQAAFGTNADNWVGKTLKVWVIEQLVQGKMKKVVYADVA
jgi:hypothetical protein